jgi:Family of unknown function (DUF5343)
MALPKSYLTSTKNLSSVLQAMQSAQAPSQFTTRFLEGVGFSSSNDRLIIGVLKSLGFLDSEARPQDRYFRYLDQTQAAQVLAEGIRDAYSDLFQVRKDAQNLTKQEVVNKAKTLSQGALGESVLDKVAATFVALCGLADFSTTTPLPSTKATGDATPAPVERANENPRVQDIDRSSQARHAALSLGGLHYNIQITLPQTRDAAVYDAIFRSLREHLID